MLKKIRPLKNIVGVFSGGSPLSKDRFDLGLTYFKNHKIEVKSPLLPYRDYGIYTNGFANGSALERLQSVEKLILDQSVDIILSARGGSGVLDIIENFPYKLLSENPKLLIGQSDMTALILQIPNKLNIPSIHGPQFGAEFADYYSLEDAKKSSDILIKLVTDPDFRYSIEGNYLAGDKKTISGKMIAGNLSMLVSLLGTPYDVPYKDSILVLEEVGESPHKIERMLKQLELSNKLYELKGLAFGRFSKCDSKYGPEVKDVINKFIEYFSKKSNILIINGLEVGHWGCSIPITIGIKGEITKNGINILESPIN